MKGIIVLFTFLILLCGCATTKSVMESWVSHRESELVSSWGAPHGAIDTRDGKRILTWESRWGQYGENICSKSFTIDESGVVRQWSYSGCLF